MYVELHPWIARRNLGLSHYEEMWMVLVLSALQSFLENSFLFEAAWNCLSTQPELLSLTKSCVDVLFSEFNVELFPTVNYF